MNVLQKKRFLFATAVALLEVFWSGCRPSVHEAVGIVSAIQLDTSRGEVKKIIFNAYSKRYPDKASKQGYALAEPPRPVTNGMINAERNLIKVLREEGHYVYVYPSDLFDKLSDKCFADGIGLVAEASEGNGSLTLYYDDHTNYIGFIAESEFGKKSR